MRISHKTAIEQMDAARKLEATDQALVLCEKQQQRITALEDQLKEVVDFLGVTPRFTTCGCDGADLLVWRQRRDSLLAKIKEGR